MTNREWLMEQMQNMSDEELAELIHVPRKMDKEVCDTLGDCFPRECEDCKLDWLKAERKEVIKLSEAERVILEKVDKKWKWITRDNCGYLWFWMGEPHKSDNGGWISDGTIEKYETCVMSVILSNLFQFIRWEDAEPYEIAELLKGE